jgi:hypothetical protein
MSRLSKYERASVQKRLAQIEQELQFPKLTESQRTALQYERLSLMHKLGLSPSDSQLLMS